jgi:GNAT superfamily N-acetyltransferase
MAERLEDASPWLCWVAEADGRVLGCLWMQSIEKVPNPVDEPERHAYVTSVYVRPDHRGRGTGAALVASALAWCRAHATDSVVLWPTDESRSLYERAGFRAPGCVMELDLRGSSPADR